MRIITAAFLMTVTLAGTAHAGDPGSGIGIGLEQIPGGVKGSVSTDANGKFQISIFLPGTYRVTVPGRSGVRGREDALITSAFTIQRTTQRGEVRENFQAKFVHRADDTLSFSFWTPANAILSGSIQFEDALCEKCNNQ